MPKTAPTGWAYLNSDCTIRWQRGDREAYVLRGNQVGNWTIENVLGTIPVPVLAGRMSPTSSLLVRNGQRLIVSAARRVGATAGDNFSLAYLQWVVCRRAYVGWRWAPRHRTRDYGRLVLGRRPSHSGRQRPLHPFIQQAGSRLLRSELE